MGFIESILDHSKKFGRMAALIIILGVAGGISILMVLNDPTSGKEILGDWIKLSMIGVTFYFLKPSDSSS